MYSTISPLSGKLYDFEIEGETPNQEEFDKIQNYISTDGNYNQEVKIGYGGLRVYGVTKVFHQQGKNDFKYFVAPDFPKRQQTNAEVSQLNILQDLYWKIDRKNQLAFHFWQQFLPKVNP